MFSVKATPLRLCAQTCSSTFGGALLKFQQLHVCRTNRGNGASAKNPWIYAFRFLCEPASETERGLFDRLSESAQQSLGRAGLSVTIPKRESVWPLQLRDFPMQPV